MKRGEARRRGAGGREHRVWALGARAAWRGARREPREAAGRRAEKSPLASQVLRHSLPLHPYPTRREGSGSLCQGTRDVRAASDDPVLPPPLTFILHFIPVLSN